MATIEIDDEVYKFLQRSAVPLIDTPNTVLRRVLLGDSSSTSAKPLSSGTSIDEGRITFGLDSAVPKSALQTGQTDRSTLFVQFILQHEFKETFKKVRGFRFMFESPTRLVYFQNFNKHTGKLWYTIAESPYNSLKMNVYRSFLCLTNAADNMAYVIPFEEIFRRTIKVNWQRNYLQINIDKPSNRWIEFDWDIEEFRKKY